jgi:hypothetical protein
VPEELVELDALEEGEVGHVVELHEQSQQCEGLDDPAQQRAQGSKIDEDGDCGLAEEGDAQGAEGLGVVGTDEVAYVLVQLLVLRNRLRRIPHRYTSTIIIASITWALK